MPAPITMPSSPTAHEARPPGGTSHGRGRWLVMGPALVFAAIFLILPLANVLAQALSRGLGFYAQAVWHPDTRAASRLTLVTSAIVVPLNTVFGLAAAWLLAKFEFRGKALLLALLDLPFAISPVVVGLMFLLLFGRQGYFGDWLDAHDVQIIFAVPGIVLVTLFVTCPFVARELIPLMKAAGSEQEQAALTLGASGWKTFWHVTLPSVKWGLLYGVILCNARAMGEFGAVSIVSGQITGQTDTLTLRVDKLYQSATAASGTAAFAVATLLVGLALLTLVVRALVEWQSDRSPTVGRRLQPSDLADPEKPLNMSSTPSAL